MTPQEAIQRAATVDAFLKDPVIDEQFKLVAVRYYEEFRRASSSEQRVQAWAKTNALEDVLTQLRIVVDSGERAVIEAAATTPVSRVP